MDVQPLFGWRLSSVAVAIVFVIGLVLCDFRPLPPTVAGTQQVERTIPPELVKAIRDGDEQAIRKLIDDGADVNSRDAEWNTPLILASFYSGPGCVELLLKRGAEVNTANKAGVTALLRAATNHEKTRLLLRAGAKVDVRTTELGNTPLILAARKAENFKTVKLLVESGANIKQANGLGVTPIMVATASGDLESVKFLLDKGAGLNDFPDVKRPNEALAAGCRTPLMWAAFRNDLPMIRLLLERGADPNKVIGLGTPLSHAAWNRNLEAAKLLVAGGARVDAKDPFAGFTPLHWAASAEPANPELVKFLLEKGADPNAEGGQHVGAFLAVPQTPRLLAEKRGRTAVVDALIAAGARAPTPSEKLTVPNRSLPETIDTTFLTASVEKALAALQTTAAKSRESFVRHISHQKCASCHQQYLPMAAVGLARNRSVRFDQNAAKEQLDLILSAKEPFSRAEFVVQSVFHPEPAHSYGYELLGLAGEKVPPSLLTDVRVHHLVTIQAADGRWLNNLPRPPMQSSDVSATALAIRAIKHYGWPGRREEFEDSIGRARQWLWKVKSETNEESVFQLLGLHWAGEPSEKLVDLTKALLHQQRKDGGWGQLPLLESDAYATGEVLYALAQITKAVETNPAWQRGMRFLLERQEDDGTWHVARRAYPFQPTMDSGFPHHRDSWVSTAATSWAVLALMQVLPPGAASGKPTTDRKDPPVRSMPELAKVDFAAQVKPLLERSCAACHSGERPRGLFRVDSRDALLKGGESGTPAVVAGVSSKSPLVDYVSDRVPESEMPPKATRAKFPRLSKDEVAVLRAWIDQGAEWPKDVTLAFPKSDK